MSGVISSVMALCCLIVLLVSHAPHLVHSFITSPQIHHKIHTTRHHDIHHTHNNRSLLYAANNGAIQEESSSSALKQQQQQDDEEKTIISYSAILKAIDRDAYNEAVQSCSYLVSEDYYHHANESMTTTNTLTTIETQS